MAFHISSDPTPKTLSRSRRPYVSGTYLSAPRDVATVTKWRAKLSDGQHLSPGTPVGEENSDKGGLF